MCTTKALERVSVLDNVYLPDLKISCKINRNLEWGYVAANICLLILIKSVVVINLITAKSFHASHHIITAHIIRHPCVSHRHIYHGGSTVCCL